MILSSRELLIALALFTVLAVAFTWPLAPRVTQEIVVSNPPANALHELYGVTWGTHALANYPHRYFQATFLYPYPSSLAFMEHLFGVALIAAPFNWITGNMLVGYNLVWLFTFVLSGLGAFLLARYLTESRTAAILAGVLYAYFPLRYQMAGELNALAVMWIPFALLSLHLWVETRLRRQLFLFLGFAFLQFISSAYTGVFLVVAGLLYVAVLLVTEWEPTLELFTRQRWVILAVVAMGLLAAVPFATPYLNSADDTAVFERTLDGSIPGSARFQDFVTPAESSLLAPLAAWRDGSHYRLFPGVIALAFMAWFIGWRGWRRFPHRPEMLFYLALGILASVLALGPRLGDVPMPFTALWYLLPGASFIATPARFATLSSLVSDARQRRLAGGMVALLAALELMAAPLAMTRPLPERLPQVYAWLATLPGRFAILELPMPTDKSAENEDFARYQLHSLVHGKRIVNGVAASVPTITRQLREEMQLFPGNASLDRLRELGVTYVLVHTDKLAPDAVAPLRQAIEQNPGLEFIEFDGPIWVVDVLPVEAASAAGG